MCSARHYRPPIRPILITLYSQESQVENLCKQTRNRADGNVRTAVQARPIKLIEQQPRLSLVRAWRWWIVPVLVGLFLAILYIDPFVGDWDGLDYTVLALKGEPSSMALGRSAFVFTNHVLWRIVHALFQLPARDAYVLFKYAILFQSTFAVIACWALAREVTNSLRTATISAFAIVLSPTFVLYSGQVMTEIPSLMILAAALTIYVRGVKNRNVWLMLAGAGLLGADVNVRETITFYAPLIVIAPIAMGWKTTRREIAIVAVAILVFLILASGVFAIWFWADVGGYRSTWYAWLETMQAEAARHPVSVGNALPFLIYFMITSPLVFVVLPFAFIKEWRKNKFSIVLGLAAVGLFANVLLFFNYSTAVNWRYFLTGLPALAPLAAGFVLRSLTKALRSESRAFISSMVILVLIAIVSGLGLAPLRAKSIEKHAITKNYRERLAALPSDAIVMAGGQTVAVTFWRGVGEGRWDVIGTGSGWPGNRLIPIIESYLSSGRRVFVDTDRIAWSPCGWQRGEISVLVSIESQFRFRRVTETIFEVRPATDSSAVDKPELQRLLPENRANDMAACSGADLLN